MMKPDLSKEGMKKFFLYHTEKLILGACLLLLGLFFWMGFKTETFDKTTPAKLRDLAEQADRYILKDTAWTEIAEKRQGDKDVLNTIIDSEGSVRATDFVVDPISGIACRALEPRQDPEIFGIEKLEADVITAPVIVTQATPQRDLFAGMELVSAGAPRGGNAFEDEEDEEPFEDEFDPETGRQPDLGSTKPDEEVEKPTVDAGTTLLTMHAHYSPGMRPTNHEILRSNSTVYNFNVVCVKGLVNYKLQYTAFENAFKSAIGFYPERDTPTYQYVQVERRELTADGQPVAGKAGQWSDISEFTSFRYPNVYPAMHRMPWSFFPSAPEIVAPENYDPVATQPIPAFVGTDYRSRVMHSALADNRREFPEPEKAEEVEETTADSLFNPTDDGAGNGEDPFGGGAAGGAPGEGIGPDVGPGAGGAPGGGAGMSLGGGRGGAGAGAGAGMGIPGMGGGEEVQQTRLGSDFTDYWKALTNPPKEDFKLVRIFDLQAKPNKTYEYRMRLWIGDPNNEDLTKTFDTRRGKAFTGTSTRGGGDDEEEDWGDEEEEEEEEDQFAQQGGQEDESKKERVYEWVQINSAMTAPGVRVRVNRAKEIEDPKKRGVKRYTVSEMVGKDEDGKEIWEEVPVPKHAFVSGSQARTDMYLKHCRPTKWSEPVRVTVTGPESSVVAGNIEQPKQVKVRTGNGDSVFDITEPAAEIVASVWHNRLGTRVPAKRKVYRGDSLDYYTAAHLVHPITWQVHYYENVDPKVQGMEKYMLPVKTGRTVVDTIGGEELALPRTEKMRHSMPSEVLVMNENGELQVRNEMDDQSDFRMLTLMPDDSKYVGRERKKKKESNRPTIEGFDPDDF